jgi:transcriptional regulator with XRE-family HTH domain
MMMPIFAYEKIKPLRQAKGLNQAEIAAELGISRPTFVLMEQGAKEPTLSQLYTLARLLGVEADELCANLPSAGSEVADYAKFKELVSACAASGADDGIITKTKLSLLTYLIDFTWHFRSMRPMTAETYRYSARGPVADDYSRALDELHEAQAIALEPQGTALTVRTVEQRHPKLLDKQELSLIDKICAKWRAESTEAMTNFIRGRVDAKSTKPGEPIPYESILAETENSLY